MSVFHKLKASLGIGAAVVDTVIDKDTYEQEESVTGVVKVKGGKVKQLVNGIELSLLTTVIVEGEDSEYFEEYCLKKVTISENTEIEPEKDWEKSFSMKLPENTPLTDEEMKVWVRTEVDIARGMDPVDVDPLTILPSAKTQRLFHALQELGFYLKKVKTVWRDSDEKDIVQMYGLIPDNGPFFEELEALVIAFHHEKDGLRVVFELDRYSTGFAGLFAEALDVDRSKHSFFIEESDLTNKDKELSDQIEKWLRSAI
ncbi:MAG TPA: sporulation protein [Bacillales bacterium]|nr:sporulation protein [Bacillales bacterium]